MNTCKTCKYWGACFDNECDFPFTITGENVDKAIKLDVVATAADDTDLRASLITGPDFGCIHWEGK